MLERQEKGWWKATFNISWEERREAPPSWHIDLFLLDNIVRHIVEKHSQEIELWQIHRRANRDFYDKTGHELEFRFWSTIDGAKKVFRTLKKNSIIGKLIKSNILNYYSDNMKTTKSLGIFTDICDQRWPDEVKACWPFFAMGVSRSLLELVGSISSQLVVYKKRQNIIEQADNYIQVSEKINELWANNSEHAFFHHLSAMFGYLPFSINVKLPLQFLHRF